MAAASRLTVGDESYEIFRIDALQDSHDVARLPYTLRILLENVLRNAGDEEVEPECSARFATRGDLSG